MDRAAMAYEDRLEWQPSSVPETIRVKNQFKEDSKKPKTTKEATKEIRNNIADGHKMYADTKCTAHGLAMMPLVFTPAAGG